jgi:hypothetical protein
VVCGRVALQLHAVAGGHHPCADQLTTFQLRSWPLWWHLSKAWHGPALLDKLAGPGIRRIRLGKIPEGGAHIDVRGDGRALSYALALDSAVMEGRRFRAYGYCIRAHAVVTSRQQPGPCVCGLSTYVDAPRTPSGLAKSSSCRWDDFPVKRARSALSGRLSSLGRCQLAAAHHASVLLRSSAVPLPGRSSSLLSQRLEPRVAGTIGGALDPAPCQRSSQEWASS